MEEETYGKASIVHIIYTKLLSDKDLWTVLGRAKHSDQAQIDKDLNQLMNKYLEQYPELKDNREPFLESLANASNDLAQFR